MAIFHVVGPLKVSSLDGKGGRAIRREDVEAFWRKNKPYRKRRGCYVFARRAGRGFTPGYVGKTRKSFKAEAFTDRNVRLYHEFLVRKAKGTPVMFFVVEPKRKGKPNASHIGEMESYLINLAFTANPTLMNRREANSPDWGIQGVIRGQKGKTSAGTKLFKQMMRV